jgi:hypothetical protein
MNGAGRHRWAHFVAIWVLALAAVAPSRGGAQVSEPCGVGCAALLGVNSITFATGTATAVGRRQGGYSTFAAAALTWGSAFTAAVGAGVALSGDGGRQRRAIRAAVIGSVGGGLTGLAIESLIGDATATTRLAATLVGAAVGVMAGGIVGAATYDGSGTPAPTANLVAAPAFSVRIRF